MLFKYVFDASAIYMVAHVVWTPWDYLIPLFRYRAAKIAVIPAGFALICAMWTLPFIWIGVTMMMKRAIDAGKSPAWCAFFLVPILNYAVMLWLAALPSVPAEDVPPVDAHRIAGARYRSALLGIAGAAAVVLIAVLLSVFAFGSYGMTLFLATPFIQGMVVGYSYNRGRATTGGETVSVVSLSVLLVGGVMLLFALEGVVCLLMALPLALGLGALGGLVGRVMARAQSGSGLGFAAAMFVVPFGATVEKISPSPPTYEAVTTVDVAAPPQTVWTHVVQFSDITESPEWYFRAGIAYPLRASIAGTGVGAVRRCEFSTGAFVEPITAWEPPTRLAFDVVDQPPPLRELSIYTKVYAPHLDGYFRSSRGEFRMMALPNGQTRLEGHTWYSVAIYPQGYWRAASELLLHRIHRRVLDQVKRESELAATAGVALAQRPSVR